MSNTYAPEIGSLGIALSSTSATAEHKLGRRVIADDGSVWIYVQDSGSGLTANSLVSINGSHVATMATAANVKVGGLATSPVALTASYYGWVMQQGHGFSVRAAASVAKGAALYTSGTAGVVEDTATTTQSKLHGIYTVVTTTASAGSREVIVNFPHYAP